MTDWPTNFTYVCAASKGMVVNAVPLAHSGWDRVGRVVIFCGASSLETEHPGERSEAVEPALRLKRWLNSGHRKLDVTIQLGHSDSIIDWHEAMTGLAQQATADRPIVLNLTGGRKQMSLGALSGCMAAPEGARRFLVVGGSPLRVDFVDLQTMRQEPARAYDELTLDQLLALHGLREIGADARRRGEKQAAECKERVERFSAAIQHDMPTIVAIVDKAVDARYNDRKQFSPGEIDPTAATVGSAPEREQAAAALMHLAGCPGIELRPTSSGGSVLHATTERGAKTLRGGWFEMLMFNRLRSEFGHRSDVGIAMNVRIGFDPADGHPVGDELGELDVVLVIRSQLHVIETKVAHIGSAGKGGAAKALAQIDKWKQLILGQFGNILVVQPRQHHDDVAARSPSFIRRARRSGAHMKLGSDAVEHAVAAVADIIKAHA